VIQGYFPAGQPRILQPATTHSAPPVATAPRPAAIQAHPAAFAPAIMLGRPGAVKPASRPCFPPNKPQPILPDATRPSAVQPFNAAKPALPQPILPPATRPATVQPSSGNAFALPPTFHLQPSGTGQRLPETVQKKMEALFSADFSAVRVHIGNEASTIGASAFTHGTDLYFAPGQYNPQTPQGQRLLGHELTHVVQQRAGRVRSPLGSGVAVVQDPTLEAEAERMGLKVATAPALVRARRSESNPHGPGSSRFASPPARSAPGTRVENQPAQPDGSTHRPILPCRSHGNQRGTRAIGHGSIQRLVADGVGTLYVPPDWMDTTFDDRAETIRQVLYTPTMARLKQELLENLSASAGFEISAIVEITDPAGLSARFMSDTAGFGAANPPRTADLWPVKAHKLRQLKTLLKQPLADALAEPNFVTYPPSDREVTAGNLKRTLVISPNHLVKAADDLGTGYDITKVCALIAVYKNEGEAAVKAKFNLSKSLKAAEDYYKRLHTYYYDERNVQYDEPVTHPGIYAEWGYQMIHAGHTTWGNLHTVLRRPLTPGKKYIIDLDNHSVAVTIKKAFLPGVGTNGEPFKNFIEFHSDSDNFNTGELNQYVEYVYEK